MTKYYLCSICGNMVEMIEDKGNTPYCCGRPMQEQRPAATDGATEKHVPVITLQAESEKVKKVTVNVGSTPHPAANYHYIKWISLKTNVTSHCARLTPSSRPEATFYIGADETIVCAYAYCNLHGLWQCIPEQ